MAQPPPAYGPPPPPPPGYTPPAPRKESTTIVIVVLLVVILVIVPVVLAVYFFVIAIPRPTGAPTVTFSSVGVAQGNASFTVTSVSQSTIFGFFEANLRVNGILGTADTLRDTPDFSAIAVGGTTYRVYWEDLGGLASVTTGDGFRITGDGVPLAPGPHTFYLIWLLNSSVSGTATWTV